MSGTLINIQQIINPAKFQKIQDDISLATGLAIITVDYTGVPLTAHSNCSEFCKRVRSSEKYHDYCEKCDSRGGLEAARIHKPFIYFCHAGVVDLAIPIIVDNLYLGAIMAGQVLLDQEDSDNKLEYIVSGVSNTIDTTCDIEIQKCYNMLTVMPLKKITALANMLLHISNYCINEAVLRASVAQRSSKKQSTESYKSPDNDDRGEFSNNYNKKQSEILQPAINYINEHIHEKISLSKMAILCNISPSYFSKLFAKEDMGNLSNYVNRVKIDRAKELLNLSDWSIRKIADNLGFDDCGYFIKVFKQNTGKTPAEFRSIHSNFT